MEEEKEKERERVHGRGISGTQEVYKDCLLLMIFPNAHPRIHRNAVIRLRS